MAEYPEQWLEVICGPMFSGKTEELMRRLRRERVANKKVQLFKPEIDNRYSKEKAVSHNGLSFPATSVGYAKEIINSVKSDTRVVGVDEVQFLDEGILEVCQELLSCRIKVIVAGLELDFRGEPFGYVPHLMISCDSVAKLTAICTKCGKEASRTQRLVNGEPAACDDPTVLVGAKECYEARCRDCHEVSPPRGMRNQMTLTLSECVSVASPEDEFSGGYPER